MNGTIFLFKYMRINKGNDKAWFTLRVINATVYNLNAQCEPRLTNMKIDVFVFYKKKAFFFFCNRRYNMLFAKVNS